MKVHSFKTNALCLCLLFSGVTFAPVSQARDSQMECSLRVRIPGSFVKSKIQQKLGRFQSDCSSSPPASPAPSCQIGNEGRLNFPLNEFPHLLALNQNERAKAIRSGQPLAPGPATALIEGGRISRLQTRDFEAIPCGENPPGDLSCYTFTISELKLFMDQLKIESKNRENLNLLAVKDLSVAAKDIKVKVALSFDNGIAIDERFSEITPAENCLDLEGTVSGDEQSEIFGLAKAGIACPKGSPQNHGESEALASMVGAKLKEVIKESLNDRIKKDLINTLNQEIAEEQAVLFNRAIDVPPLGLTEDEMAASKKALVDLMNTAKRLTPRKTSQQIAKDVLGILNKLKDPKLNFFKQDETASLLEQELKKLLKFIGGEARKARKPSPENYELTSSIQNLHEALKTIERGLGRDNPTAGLAGAIIGSGAQGDANACLNGRIGCTSATGTAASDAKDTCDASEFQVLTSQETINSMLRVLDERKYFNFKFAVTMEKPIDPECVNFCNEVTFASPPKIIKAESGNELALDLSGLRIETIFDVNLKLTNPKIRFKTEKNKDGTHSLKILDQVAIDILGYRQDITQIVEGQLNGALSGLKQGDESSGIPGLEITSITAAEANIQFCAKTKDASAQPGSPQ